MADFQFSDDHELKQLNAQVLADPEEFEHWDKLVRAAESQEGGLNRNSSSAAITATRGVYDNLLARFPLFFGYWKKYADLEFTIGGTEAAEMVYERGVASIGTSVDLWANYCSFKVDTSHDNDVIRELFQRGADSVGLDFLAHPFWDKYLDFEERAESPDHIFSILSHIIHIPMHQYARYFERYRTMAATRPLDGLAPEDDMRRFRKELGGDGAKDKSDNDFEKQLRARLDKFHMDIFHNTQTETTKRWTYESEIKRPYYHVTELDDAQLVNWNNYLDFEEAEGDYARIKFLYERCLVTAANYDDFWFRYARWMFAQANKQDEVRNIFLRACCIYVRTAQPNIRLFFAQFEEAEGRPESAVAIHEAILDKIPDHIDTITSLANIQRRQYGLESAIKVLRKYKDDGSAHIGGALTSEWARLLWKIQGNPAGARQVFESNEYLYLDSESFWTNWLEFEMHQHPTSQGGEPDRNTRVKEVFEAVRSKSSLPPGAVKDLAATYFNYLSACGPKDAMKQYVELDNEIHGTVSIARSTPVGGGLAAGAHQQAGTVQQFGGLQAEVTAPATNGGRY